MPRPSCRSSLVLLLFLLCAPAASAQDTPATGVRAAGMGGAFTAVADDATAAVWNPAGLASGSFASLVADRNAFDRQSVVFAGVGVPPLGVSYFRTATAAFSNGRNTLVTHNFGITLVQSLGDRGIAVGTTLRLVHGIVSSGTTTFATNAFDADVGVMASGGLGQIGIVVHNLARPSFSSGPAGTGEDSLRLNRRVRTGVSVNVRQHTTVAADVDLTTSQSSFGEWRDAAIGVETQPARRTWLRGGLHWNTHGGAAGAAPIATAGGSYALRGALMADVQGSFGSARGNRGWGAGLRVAF